MATTAGKQIDADPLALKEAGVKFLLASYVDMHGVAKAKMVPVDHYPQMLAGSELFTGAANDGVPQEVSDEEVSARPIPNPVRSCRGTGRSPGSQAICGAPDSRSSLAAAISSAAFWRRRRTWGSA